MSCVFPQAHSLMSTHFLQMTDQTLKVKHQCPSTLSIWGVQCFGVFFWSWHLDIESSWLLAYAYGGMYTSPLYNKTNINDKIKLDKLIQWAKPFSVICFLLYNLPPTTMKKTLFSGNILKSSSLQSAAARPPTYCWFAQVWGGHHNHHIHHHIHNNHHH